MSEFLLKQATILRSMLQEFQRGNKFKGFIFAYLMKQAEMKLLTVSPR
jgi:hypothetical protein